MIKKTIIDSLVDTEKQSYWITRLTEDFAAYAHAVGLEKERIDLSIYLLSLEQEELHKTKEALFKQLIETADKLEQENHNG